MVSDLEQMGWCRPRDTGAGISRAASLRSQVGISRRYRWSSRSFGYRGFEEEWSFPLGHPRRSSGPRNFGRKEQMAQWTASLAPIL